MQDRQKKSKCFSGIWSHNICSHQMVKYIDMVKFTDYSRETDSLMIQRSQQGYSNIMLLYGCEYLNSTHQLDAIVLMHSSYPGLMIKHTGFTFLFLNHAFTNTVPFFVVSTELACGPVRFFSWWRNQGDLCVPEVKPGQRDAALSIWLKLLIAIALHFVLLSLGIQLLKSLLPCYMRARQGWGNKFLLL